MEGIDTYEDENVYAVPGNSTRIRDNAEVPPLPPPRRPATFNTDRYQNFGSANTLQTSTFGTRNWYRTSESRTSTALTRGPGSLETMHHNERFFRVPSEFQLSRELSLLDRSHIGSIRFTSTKGVNYDDDGNGMFVIESLHFPLENWTMAVEKLIHNYDEGHTRQKQDIERHIATKELKCLKGLDIAGVSRLLAINSDTITAIVVPFLLEETLELHTDNIDTVLDALEILSDKFQKDYSRIILIIWNMVCFVHSKLSENHTRKNDICKTYLKACKAFMPRAKGKSRAAVYYSLLAQFIEQFKYKKRLPNKCHTKANSRKKDTHFKSMGFFEQYSYLFEIINEIFTLSNLTQVQALQEVVSCIVEQKQKPQTDECLKQESLLRLITISCLVLLKNDAFLDFQSKEFPKSLLDLLESIFNDKDVLQETRISLIEHLEPLLLTENTDIAKGILKMFIVNHRCPVQMSKLAKNFIERELLHTGIRLANDTSLNEQTPTWEAIEGSLMKNREIIVHCLVPTQACLTKGYSEYKGNANKDQTDMHLNNLEILQRLHNGSTHPSIIKLFAFQRQPIPLLYITEKLASITLNEYLLNRRSKSKWIGLNALAILACQAIDVLIYLHERHIVHRDLTSHSFQICNGGDKLVLHNFSIAIGTENCAESTTATNCQLIPTLWSSPESILEDKFSMKSDTWMLGHVMYEIFTHGCQPYTEMYTFSIDKIISYVVFHHLKPKRWPCIPPEIHELIKNAQHYQPTERIDLSEILQKMKDFVRQSPGKLQRSQSSTSRAENIYPDMDTKQGPPVRGIPPLFLLMKEQSIKDSNAIYNIYLNLGIKDRSQNTKLLIEIHELTSAGRPRVIIQDNKTILVTEAVTASCVDIIREHLNPETLTDVLHMVNSPTWKKTLQPNEFDYQVEYQLKCCTNLTDLAKSRQCGDPYTKEGEIGYLKIVLKVVQFVLEMNNRRWILGSIRCSDMYITSDNEKVVMARLGRMLWLDPSGVDDDYVIAKDDCADSMRWCPIDVIHYKQYSVSSDVYSLAMAIYEFYMTISVYQQNPLAGEPECAPFPCVSRENLQEHLYCDGKPERPAVCPKWLYDQLCLCWNKDKEERPTCDQLVQSLQRYIKLSCEPVEYEVPPYDIYEAIPDEQDVATYVYNGLSLTQNVQYDLIIFECVNSDSESE